MVAAALVTVWVWGGWGGGVGKADRGVCGAGRGKGGIVGGEEVGVELERKLIEGAVDVYCVWMWQGARWRTGGVFGGWSCGG